MIRTALFLYNTTFFDQKFKKEGKKKKKMSVEAAAGELLEIGAGVIINKMEEKEEADYIKEKENRKERELIHSTNSIRHDSSAVLRQEGNLEDSMHLLTKKHFEGLNVEPTPQIVEGIVLCEGKEYPRAIRILRKNTEEPGTVNWCRMVLYSSYATFFHCSRLYFLNRDLAKQEGSKCCGKPERFTQLSEEMRELIRQSLKDCHEVARTILDAEKSVMGEELDLTCQMCFSIMSLGNAYQLQDDKFLDHALGLAGVWANKRNTVLAHTEKAMLESKRLEDPMQKINEAMDGMAKDLMKLGKNVKNQGSSNIAQLAISTITSAI